jgi:hypothetical protein
MMAMNDWRPLALGLALALTACGDGESEIYSGPFPRAYFARTDSSTYQMTGAGGSAEEVVQVTYTNLYSAPIFYARCTPGSDVPRYSLIRPAVDSGVPIYRDEVPTCVGGVSTGKLEEGESITFSVSFTSSTESGGPMAERSGRLQIVILTCQRHRSDSDHCDPRPYDNYSRTNEFTLTPPPPDPASE